MIKVYCPRKGGGWGEQCGKKTLPHWREGGSCVVIFLTALPPYPSSAVKFSCRTAPVLPSLTQPNKLSPSRLFFTYHTMRCGPLLPDSSKPPLPLLAKTTVIMAFKFYCLIYAFLTSPLLLKALTATFKPLIFTFLESGHDDSHLALLM